MHAAGVTTENWQEQLGAWHSLQERLGQMRSHTARLLLIALLEDDRLQHTLALVEQLSTITSNPPAVTVPAAVLLRFKEHVNERLQKHYFALAQAIEREPVQIDRLFRLRSKLLATLATACISLPSTLVAATLFIARNADRLPTLSAAGLDVGRR
jgi:hypothetical protein